jgi:prepilin-type N-terminal cleavage/methylation domain-containing protein
MSFADRARTRLADDAGFSMIELMIAMVICLVGITGALTVFDSARTMTTKAQKREAAVAQAERELERVISRPWAEIAHPQPSFPAATSNPKHPSSFVTGGTPPRYRWDQSATGSASPSAMLSTNAGTVPVAGLRWRDPADRVRGWVFRYVTDAGNDGGATIRRVTVAVTVDAPDAPDRYVLVSALVTNPTPA